MASESDNQSFTVAGTVSYSNGNAVPNLIVIAYDQDLRRQQLLGRCKTSKTGVYKISYTRKSFCRAEKGSADLCCSVQDKEGAEIYTTPLSGILFNAPLNATVNITLPQKPAPIEIEYEVILATLKTLLDGSGLESPASLCEDDKNRDITFLSKETGFDPSKITYVAVAFKLSMISKNVSPEFYYALLVEGILLQTDLSSSSGLPVLTIDLTTPVQPLLYDVVLLPTDTITSAVKAAIAAHYVSSAILDRLSEILKTLGAYKDAAQRYKDGQGSVAIQTEVVSVLNSGQASSVLNTLTTDARGDLLGSLQKLQDALVSTESKNKSQDKDHYTQTKDTDTMESLPVVSSFGPLQVSDSLLHGIIKEHNLVDEREVLGLQPSELEKTLNVISTDDLETFRRNSSASDTRDAIRRDLEKKYPTTAFAIDLKRDGSAFQDHRTELLDIFDNHQELDLATANIKSLFPGAKIATKSTSSSQTTARDTFASFQRLFKITPKYQHVKSLMDAGIRSGSKIHSIGLRRFEKVLLDGDSSASSETARSLFNRATNVAIGASIRAADLASLTGATRIAALSPPNLKLDAVAAEFPNLQTLFQIGDFCACSDCRTVHSAAAYVADTLHYLSERIIEDKEPISGQPPFTVAKDVLFSRRPDLGDMDLSCDNTNITLPYIDVVCELLEEAVAPDQGTTYPGQLNTGLVPASLLSALIAAGMPFTAQAFVSDPNTIKPFDRVVRDTRAVAKLQPAGTNEWTFFELKQTYSPQDEVEAMPQYVNQNAYKILEAAEYAFGLPFSLAHQESEGYFNQFAVSRADLMKGLQTPAGPLNSDIAAEVLGLTTLEYALIGTPEPNASKQDIYWNNGSGASAVITMGVVEAFVDKTGMSYSDLQGMLNLSWINPNNVMFIQHLDGSCDLSMKRIAKIDDSALDRFHRFIRLMRKISIPSISLNRLILAKNIGNNILGKDASGGDSLLLFAALQQLYMKLGLPWDVLSYMFDTISTDGEPVSPYSLIFLNSSKNGTVDEDFTIENLAANDASSPTTAKKMTDTEVVAYLALCLGISILDTQALVAILGESPILNLKNVSGIYSLAKLAQSIHLPKGDLQICQKLIGADLLNSPITVLDFVDQIAAIRVSGVSPSDLQYYLTHEASNLNARDLSDVHITSILAQLQTGYSAAMAANVSPYNGASSADVNMSPVSDQLSKVPSLTPDDIATYKAMLAGTPWTDTTTTAVQFIDSTLSGIVLDTTQIKAAQIALAGVPLNNDNENERKTLIEALADGLAAFFISLAKDDFLTNAIETELKISDDLAPVLLQYAMMTTPAITSATTLKDILEEDFAPLPNADTDNKTRALQILQVLNAFVSTLNIPADRITWMFLNNAALGVMQLDSLKYRNDSALPDVDINAWFALQDILYLVNTYPAVVNPVDLTQPFTVYGMFDLALSSSASVDSTLHYYAQVTGLDEVILDDLSTLFAYNVSQLQVGTTYRQLETCSTLLRTLGLSVAQGQAVSKALLGPDDATTLRQALKARYDESDWLGVLKTIQDPLRRQKRDALVNYLLAVNPSIQTTDDLYDYFLIDTQMGSCMDTSRVVQAHATIQLFVQRCLLGLEPHSVASTSTDPRWSEWNEWMANYRLWELNKQLYLFPHAYLDEGVRKDKSELFLDFESSLQQDQLSDTALETSFAKYLEALQGIAQLDVLTCYYETDITTMHVFARTKGGDPATYYHREFPQERSWTPWDTINVDITGDTLMVFDRNSRLTMAWPIFTEETDPSQSAQGPNIPESDKIKDPGQPNPKVQKHWKIQLAVSEWVDGNWTAKKVSRDALYYPSLDSAQPYIPVDELESSYPETSFTFFPYSGTSLGQAIACFGYDGWLGAFALTGCSGYPEATQASYDGPIVYLPQFEDTALVSGRYTKNNDGNEVEFAMRWILSLSKYMPILETPELNYTITYPLQVDLVDTIVAVFTLLLTRSNKYSEFSRERDGIMYQFGTFMPFFYGDSDRLYTIIPGLYNRWYIDDLKSANVGSSAPNPTIEKTYSDLYTFVQTAYDLVMSYITAYEKSTDPNKNPQQLLGEITSDKIYLQLVAEYEGIKNDRLLFRFRFRNFYHPLVCALRKALNGGGIPALMDRQLQLQVNTFVFSDTYDPAVIVHPNYPCENLDFDAEGAYAGYNWELFFHCIYEVGAKLNQDQQFDVAQKWYHYIFNPLGAGDDPAPKRYWVTKPFQLRTSDDYLQERIDKILGRIASDPTDADSQIDDLKQSILDWRANPFDPWAIARTRTVEYQIATVLAYVKNLCDWGDSLFRQFTREAITQATQLYILAHKLLGPKPRVVAPALDTPIQSYNELESKIDLSGNALIDMEHFIPDLSDLPHGGAELPPLPYTSLYFCIPPDDNLLSYWDLVDDRLSKIRTCRNIDGIEATLALFSPPIDFGALSRALAGGQSVSSFLSALNAPLPNYKFQVMIDKATEVAAFASSLGNALLDALEKSDIEAMDRLKSQDQLLVLKTIRDAKLGAIKEAKSAYDGLSLTQAISQTKFNWYSTQPLMNGWEITATALSGGSLICQAAIALGYALSGGLKLIPAFMAGGAGFGGSPTVTVTLGGQQVGSAAEMAVQTISAIALGLEKAAGMASSQASYRRRADEWSFQADVATAEINDIGGKIATAQIQYDNAVLDLATHDQQTASATAEDAFLHSKYTNKELYDWMVQQVSQTYRAAYQLAFDMGRKAERCYQLELGLTDTFLSFNFDTLKKGLKAADSLQASLNLMSTSYLDNNKRELEITKDVSLRFLDPQALIMLKTTGKTSIFIPETIFDLDFPGHYFRRHKSVSISIPCITGPFSSVSCTLSLINNRYRRTTDLNSAAPTAQEAYDESGPGNDSRFMYNVGSIQSVATSTCVADSGLFQLNFDDTRFLPFEGTGCIATWSLEFPSALPSFDFQTISDVILHIHYTARDGGSSLAGPVRSIQLDEVNTMLNAAKGAGLYQFYSLRQTYPAAWNTLRVAPGNQTSLTLKVATLPFFARAHNPAIDKVILFAGIDSARLPAGQNLPSQVRINVNGETNPTLLSESNSTPGQYQGTSSTVPIFGTAFTLALVGWTADQIAAMEDVVLVVHYALS